MVDRLSCNTDASHGDGRCGERGQSANQLLSGSARWSHGERDCSETPTGNTVWGASHTRTRVNGVPTPSHAAATDGVERSESIIRGVQ